jgi:hypothetical protein
VLEERQKRNRLGPRARFFETRNPLIRTHNCNRDYSQRIFEYRKRNMISKIHLFAAALAGVLACSAAGAQVRSDATPTRLAATPARPASRVSAKPTAATAPAGPSSVQRAIAVRTAPGGRISSNIVPFANTLSLNNLSGIHGLGFGFAHPAPVGGGLGNNSFSHFGGHGRSGQGPFVGILFGGFPYYYDDSGSDQSAQQVAQQTDEQTDQQAQQDVSAQQNVDTRDEVGNQSAYAPEDQPQAPVRDVGDFILVRRDGRILFASIFSVVGTQLQYVTPEGIRRTLAIADLDAAATQQINEARGTTLQFQN